MDPGAIVLVVAMLLLAPALFVAGMSVTAIIGWALKEDAEARHEGSELIDLNR